MPDEIIIKIKRRRKRNPTAGKNAPISNGIIRARTDSEYQARRLNKTGIRIYNLNRRFAGSVFSDLNFTALADVFPTGGFYTPAAGEFQDLKTAVFASPSNVESLAANHAPIAKSEAAAHQLTVYSTTFEPLYAYDDPADASKFGAGGLTFPEPEDIGTIVTIDGEILRLGTARITAGFAIDAPGVSFSFRGDEQIFLMPRLYFIGAYASDATYTGAPRPNKRWYLNGIFATVPNAMLPFFTLESYSSLLFSVIHNSGNFDDVAGDTTRYRLVWNYIDRIKAFFSIRAGVSEFPGDGSGFPPFSPAAVEEFGQPTFPDNAPTPGINYDPQLEEQKTLQSVVEAQNAEVPRLLAVIYQGTNKFFCWQS